MCLDCGRATRESRCAACAARENHRRYLIRGKDWKRVRAFVLQRDGHRCTRCGRPCPHPGHLPVDHIQPLNRRPDLRYDPRNCRTLCGPCHVRIGARG